jgi:methylmalonyl-CoA/ethylmalonyl-CoA epimerase
VVTDDDELNLKEKQHMIKKLDHMTFAVHDRVTVGARIQNVYGGNFLMTVRSEPKQYVCDMYMIEGDIILGLLEPTSPESFVAKHLEKFGESLQHIGVDVDNLDDAIQIFDDNAIKYGLYEEVENIRREVIVSPKYTFGTVMQVMEWFDEFKTKSSEERMRIVWNEIEGAGNE